MASGIKVDDEVKEVYQKIHMKTTKQTKYKYAIFKYSDCGKFIVLDEKHEEGEKEFDYDSVISELPEKSPRFLAYDFDHLDKDTKASTSAVIMISW